ncbi:MAG: ABC transporter ATP-binding protein [Gaiella sp.]
MMAAAIAVHDVSVRFGRSLVLDGVSLEVEAGEWLALIGPNGAGKTTLLRAISGLVRCTGTVEVGGRPVREVSRRELARLIAVVPQQPATPSWLTVSEYVLLGRTPHLSLLAAEGTGDLAAAERALRRLDLLDVAHRPLGTLSGGEVQRAVVARAIAQEASIVLLDEPIASLDIGHQQQMLELLDELRDEAALTLVAAVHDLTLAAQYADRVVLLVGGRVAAEGSPAEVLTEEALSRHYDASVRIVKVDDTLAVVPLRAVSRR